MTSPKIRGQGIQMAQVHVTDLAPGCALRVHRGGDRAMRRAPRYDQQVAMIVAGGDNIRNVLHDRRDFSGADAHHVFVVQRFVVDVAGDILFFQATDAVLQSGRSGDRPRPRQRVRIAFVGQIGVRRIFLGRKRHLEFRDVLNIRNFPGLRTVGQIAVGQNNHGNHVFHGDAAGFQRRPEAIAGRGWSNDRDWRFRIAPVERLQ